MCDWVERSQGEGAMEGRWWMEKIAITQEETRGHVEKDKADFLYIVLSLIASVDFIRRLLLISVLSP